MHEDYKVAIQARGDGLEYRERTSRTDHYETYRFDLRRSPSLYTVVLPPSKGESFAPYSMTDEERKRILPRIRDFLLKPRFGVVPRRYAVQFSEEPYDVYYRGDAPR